MSTLFTPFRLGRHDLANRVTLAPLTRCRATSAHVPTPMMATYYAQRAAGGLLITEGTAPAANGCGYARIPGIYNDEQMEGWAQVTKAVHAAGGRIALQIMHTGRVSHPLNMPEGSEILAPSAVRAPGEMYTDQEGPQPHPEPRAMSAADIDEAITSYVVAAKRAIGAGFDYVELHGANGYLIDQFLTPGVNERTDEWGGEREGRARFALEVARRVVAAVGGDRVGIRLSPGGVFNGITPWEGLEGDFLWLAEELGALGLVYLHMVDHEAMGAPPLPEGLKRGMREAFAGAFILSGGYFDAERANADLDAKGGDLVAFGRAYLANPDLVARLQAGAPLNEANHATFYTPGEAGYTDYPTLG